MKKILLSMLGVAAFIGLVFAFSNTVEAGGGPHLTITNSNGSWEVREGSRYTFTVNALPVTADMQIIYLYVDGDIVKRCSNTRTCSNTISSVERGTHNIYAVGYDYSGRIYYLNTTNRMQQFTGRSEASSQVSSVTLTRRGEARVGTRGTAGVFLEARARGTNLSTIKITRTDDSRKSVSVSCERMQKVCALGIYPTFTTSDAGKTYVYEAIATDSSGNVKYSQRLSVQVLNANGSTATTTPNPSGIKPTVTLVPAVSTLDEDQKVTVRGNASNRNGIWGMEVRALPSWTNTPITKRCILNNEPTTGSCSMDIGPFDGHDGDSVKVWTIYWDAETGIGYSSEQKTLRINNNGDEDNRNFTLDAYAPRFIMDDERVTFTARTSQENTNGTWTNTTADEIKLYVNGNLVRTCNNTRTCSYTGGPYGTTITHVRDRVSYYATARRGNETRTTATQYSYIDYNEIF